MTEDTPTLRLVTLRRLCRGTIPPVVGTLRLGDLVHANDRDELAARLVHAAPVLEAEEDIEAARAAMSISGMDRVIVIGTSGELLGILTDRDVRERQAA